MTVGTIQQKSVSIPLSPGFNHLRQASQSFAPPGTNLPPPGYEEADHLAKVYHEFAERLDIPRYTCKIPRSWRPANLVAAWEEQAFSAIRSTISLEGSVVPSWELRCDHDASDPLSGGDHPGARSENRQLMMDTDGSYDGSSDERRLRK